MKIRDYSDLIYNLLFLGAYLSLMIITVLLGAYGIFTLSYIIILVVVGVLYLVTQTVQILQRQKMLFFSNIDFRKGAK